MVVVVDQTNEVYAYSKQEVDLDGEPVTFPIVFRTWRPEYPVSYTHLDVYKRQGYHLFISLLEVRIDFDADLVELIAKQVAALSKDCLLYTSRCV